MQGKHVINDDPRGQRPGSLLHLPGFREYFINEVTMNETRQDPDPNPVGHPGAAYDIYAHGTEDSEGRVR